MYSMEKKKFRYITAFAGEDFFLGVKRGMEEATAMLKVQAEFTGTEGDDLEELSRLIIDTVEEGYDGIAVALVDEEGLAPAVAYARDRGVPVVAFNVGGTGKANVLSSVCQNVFLAGEIVGERISDKIGEGTILITLHDDVDVLRQRRDGILQGLATKGKKPAYKVLISGNTPELACSNILKELENDETIVAVIGTGQSDTHGAGLAAKRTERQIYIAGFDVCRDIEEMIREGVIDFTIDQQPYVQGFYPVLQLWQYVTYGIVPSDINSGNTVIDGNKYI